tara:strand:+ start:178 stop:354 length:177 start_codon:yes stop_codon:yes gene_type:complete
MAKTIMFLWLSLKPKTVISTLEKILVNHLDSRSNLNAKDKSTEPSSISNTKSYKNNKT